MRERVTSGQTNEIRLQKNGSNKCVQYLSVFTLRAFIISLISRAQSFVDGGYVQKNNNTVLQCTDVLVATVTCPPKVIVHF